MQKTDFEFLSADGRTKIHAVKWMPDAGEYTAVLQIAHGMKEYIERYQEFAEFLTGKGLLVVGHDHLGHGDSVENPEDYGFFAEENPSDTLILDMHTLRKLVQKEYGDKPYFMLGHSMGSYMLRKYITRYSKGLGGAIIVGTGSMQDDMMWLGMNICKLMGKQYGWHYRSALVKHLSFLGSYREYDVTGGRIEDNWLTRDLVIAAKFYLDPKCRFEFTVNGYYGLMETIYYVNQKSNIEKVSKTLPLLLVSGNKDPVGNMGRGVRKVYRQYKAAGISDVKIRLYRGARHEILNEINRDVVFEEIYRWISNRIMN